MTPINSIDLPPSADTCLKARIMRAAAEHARRQREADEIVLCDCPDLRPGIPHARTLGDMARMAHQAEYECRLQRAVIEGETPNVPRQLARMGANKVHVDVLSAAPHKQLERRIPLLAARYWWDSLSLDARHECEGRPAMRATLAQRMLARGPRRPWLALLGDADAGKTLAATYGLWQWAKAFPWNSRPGGGVQRRPGLLVRVQTLARASAWDEMHEELRAAEMLVLDDWGAEQLSATAEAALTELMDVRYGRGALTIITSQLNCAEIAKRFDGERGEAGPGRIWRRVKERALVLEGDVLWSGDVQVPGAQWMGGAR
ncbi:ATP-binding protein [Myxococcaceae bacterium JPH2]|nr:ATP-binding protein [Myxococcaceae bacterium JPH2]